MKATMAILISVFIHMMNCIFAQPYALKSSVVGSGGGISSNNNYQIIGTLGQPVIGEISGADHINLVGFWHVANFQACTPGLFGDVSGDDTANSTDALIILSFDAGLTIPPPILDRITIGFGDVNEDALTNSTDALIILSYDAGIPIPFPVGDPVCLTDSSHGTINLTKTSSNYKARIEAMAIPTAKQIVHGESIEIPVLIDISNLPEKLGSFTAELEWNPKIFEFEKYTGGSTDGFENPVVNARQVEKGKLTFAHAYPYGADDEVNILNVSFKVVGEVGSSSFIALRFRAMSAAMTFMDLLPYVEVKDTDLEFTVLEIPVEYGIENYPNPFNPVTQIRYALPKPSHVKIELFNVLGQRVIKLLDAHKDAGYHTIMFDASIFASGVYFYRIQANKFVDVKKMMLVR